MIADNTYMMADIAAKKPHLCVEITFFHTIRFYETFQNGEAVLSLTVEQ